MELIEGKHIKTKICNLAVFEAISKNHDKFNINMKINLFIYIKNCLLNIIYIKYENRTKFLKYIII